MGGPGSGPKKGDRPQLSPEERLRRAKLSLHGMYPTALEAVSKIINAEEPDPATVRWVVEMKDGRPTQPVAGKLSGEWTIRVVYEKLPEKTE